MTLSEILLEMTFDAGHRIVGHKGKCARLHGHTYKVEIRAVGPIKEPGFVVDFGDLKEIVNEWDHKLLLWDRDNMHHLFPTYEDLKREGIILLQFNPTAENMADYLAKELGTKFNLLEVYVTLWETPKACATARFVQDTVPL